MEEYEFNSPSHLPPVDCPLVILTDQGPLLAKRTSYVSKRTDEMMYKLEGGDTILGRFKWTYP